MPNASVTQMVNDLATVIVDNTAQQNYQDEVIFEYARGGWPSVLVQTGASFTQAIAKQATYSLPTVDSARTILTVHYDTTQLAKSRKDEAWMLSPEWRTSPKAKPIAYLTDPENRTDYSLVPPPIISGLTPATPFDETWEPRNILVLYAKTDLTFATGPYEDIQLPLALETLARELARDSDHQDEAAAGIAHNLGDFFLAMSFPEKLVPGLKTGTP